MKKRVCGFVASVLLGCVVGASAQALNFGSVTPTIVESAPKDVNFRPAQTGDAVREIRIRHVPLDVMAHWLDPKIMPAPRIDLKSRDSWVSNGHHEEDAPRVRPVLDIELPEGVYITRYSNEKNTLEIAGSPDNVQRAENLIHQIDQPLQQIETEAQLVLLGQNELKSLRLQWMPSGRTLAGHPMQEAKLNLNPILFRQRLADWNTAKKAKVITAPRAISIVNTVANLRSATITTAGFDYYLNNQVVKINFNTPGVRNIPGFSSSLGVMIVPEVISDEIVRARVQLSRVLALSFQNHQVMAQGLKQMQEDVQVGRITSEDMLTHLRKGLEPGNSHFLGYGDGLEKVITVKDGEGMAFTGFDTDAFLDKPNTKEQAVERRGKTLVAFVTMRTIRRHDQTAALPKK